VRARALAVATAALALGACMKIYPDPELPDIVVEWSVEEGCSTDVATMRIEAVRDAAPDEPPVVEDVVCSSGEGRIEDLARERYTVTVVLLDDEGEILGRAEPLDADLRDGTSSREHVWFFLRDEGLVTVAWSFANGETCASLGAMSIQIEAFPTEDPLLGNSVIGADCSEDFLPYYGTLLAGSYTFQIRAYEDATFTLRAASDLLENQIVPDKGAVLDLGTLEVHRCPPCEDLPGQPPPPPPE
jgi:hypothetical protein